MRIIIVLLVTVFSICILNAQEKIKVDLYKSTEDYMKRTYTDTSVALIVRKVGDEYIWIKKFIDEKTGAKLKKAATSWAIAYEGSNYFNLGYSTDLNNWRVFIKFDVEGPNYCAAYIGPNAPSAIKNSGTNYGGGLQGVLMKDSNKWGKSWVDKNGEKQKILFIDLNKQKGASMSRNKSSLGNLLAKRDVRTTFGVNKNNSEIKKMSFEEITEIMTAKNK